MKSKTNLSEEVSKAPGTDLIILYGSIWLTALLWSWAIPAAYFWHLANNNDIVLPYIPRLAWLLPGKLWQLGTSVYIILLVITSVALGFLFGRKVFLYRLTRLFSIVIFVAIIFVHLLWGTSLLMHYR